VDLLIGDVYQKVLDLSDKPSEIKVSHRNIDEGEWFALCLANQYLQMGDCTKTENGHKDQPETVYLTVE
jgi:hypothetical protein